jgi:5-hydroxyisourate hydrolase-like protein (transthyretin family)
MKPISVHVVDIANGVVARGMRVEIVSLSGDDRAPVLAGKVGNNGLVEDLENSDRMSATTTASAAPSCRTRRSSTCRCSASG